MTNFDLETISKLFENELDKKKERKRYNMFNTNRFENQYSSQFTTSIIDSQKTKIDFMVKAEFTNKRSNISVTFTEIDVEKNEITGRYIIIRFSKNSGSVDGFKNEELSIHKNNTEEYAEIVVENVQD